VQELGLLLRNFFRQLMGVALKLTDRRILKDKKKSLPISKLSLLF